MGNIHTLIKHQFQRQLRLKNQFILMKIQKIHNRAGKGKHIRIIYWMVTTRFMFVKMFTC